MAISLPLKSQSGHIPAIVAGGSSPAARRGVRLAALRVPLAAKLVGANLAVLLALVAVLHWLVGAPLAVLIAAAGALAFVHVVLVMIALRPIRDLEYAAARVWSGDLGARVDRSAVADDSVLRVGSMFNILLDSLAADRARMRLLAKEVIAAGDRERAALARELHDSTAQQVAALLLQLSAAARDASDPSFAERLNSLRDSTAEILEELRMLSHTLHPAVLDDLGLEAALRKLARDSSCGTGVEIDVKVRADKRLPPDVESVLYRVAQEATRNAVRHGRPRRVRLDLVAERGVATLDVHDDGVGFDLAEADRARRGMGLLSMRERVALVDGTLGIKTAPRSGTTITATVPLGAAPESRLPEH